MPIQRKVSLNFDEYQSIGDLSNFLGISRYILDEALSPSKTDYGYIKHTLPKKGKRGGSRVVWEAPYTHGELYKILLRHLDIHARSYLSDYPHPCAFGYLKSRSTFENAELHCKAPLVLHADIQNFFNSINREAVEGAFKKLGVSSTLIGDLTSLVVINNKLPLGIHTSPFVSNIVCIDLDKHLETLSKKHECVYSRYADDITISGGSLPSKAEIRGAVERHGFVLAKEKYRITKPGQAHYVTGLNVSEERPRAPKELKRKIRQVLYYCEKYGILNHSGQCGVDPDYEVRRISGMLKYLKSIEPDDFCETNKHWHDLLKKEKLNYPFRSFRKKEGKNFKIYVDESVLNTHGTMGICLTMFLGDKEKVFKEKIGRVVSKYVKSPYLLVNKEKIKKVGLHWVDSSEDMKREGIDCLSRLPFKSYIAFCSFSKRDNYEDCYLKLVLSLILNRFRHCDGGAVEIIFEENSKISKEKLIKKVKAKYDELRNAKTLCPKKIDVKTGSKSEYPPLSIPDYMLGVFFHYIHPPKGFEERRMAHFEQLRDKYKFILDLDNGREYHRRNPFEKNSTGPGPRGTG